MEHKPFIEIPTPKGSEIINPEDIISIHSDDKLIYLSLENKPRKIVRLSIGKVEKKLTQAYFTRCHQRYIINILKIREIINNCSMIILVNDEQIPVSRTYKKLFKQTLDEYCCKLEG